MKNHRNYDFFRCYHRFLRKTFKKTGLFLFIFIIFIIGTLHPENSVLIDFSLLPEKSTMNLFTLYYLPSMQRVPGAVKVKQTDKKDFYTFSEYKTKNIPIMEITVDFSNAPAYTIGAALLSPFILPPQSESGINEPENHILNTKEHDLVNKVDGYSPARNIGALKTIQIIARSNTDNMEICIVLADEEEQDTLFFFEGFRENQWLSLGYKNPDYIRDVRNLNYSKFIPGTSILPYLLFKGLVIYKPEKNKDQKVILLVQSISLNYDRAYPDYDNE